MGVKANFLAVGARETEITDVTMRFEVLLKSEEKPSWWLEIS